MSEMKKLRAAVVGYGNIGRYTIEALEAAPDFEIAGVVRRDPSNVPYELRPYRVVSRIEELEDVDVAILCTPYASGRGYRSADPPTGHPHGRQLRHPHRYPAAA